MICKLPWGTDTCAVDLRGLRVRQLAPSGPAGRRDVAALVAAAVDGPLDGKPLLELARGRRRAAVVAPDATRAAALPAVLPVLLERLDRGGIDARSTTVVVACGTHPSVDKEDLAELLGPLPPGVRCFQHDARDDGGLVAVGELRSGVPLRLARPVAQADLVVTVGPVKHHYFAGFGGGPKLLFPGVAGHSEIQANHALVLRQGREGLERHPGCEPGVLDGNPLAEEIARAADQRPPDMCVCLVPGSGGGIAAAVAGPWRGAFAAAVDRVRAGFEIPAEPHRLIVACGGGAPSDQTLIQAHKGLDAACRFAAEGGEVLFAAELAGGSGSAAMEPFLTDPRPGVILARLAEDYVQYGHTTLRLVEKTARYRVHLHSRLERSLAERLGFVPTPDPGQVIESWRDRFAGTTVGVMALGSVYPSMPKTLGA